MRKLLLTVAILLTSEVVFGQAATPTADVQPNIEENPFASARAASMGGALSPVADGVAAAYYNPAGIGGVENPKGKGLVRQLHFPYAGTSYNENSRNMYGNFEADGISAAPLIESAVEGAQLGKNQYSRLSLFPNIVIGRLLLGPVLDQQMAAVPTDTDGVVRTQLVQRSGFVAGASFSDTKGRLMLGLSGGSISRKDIVGDFNAADMADVATRDAVVESATQNYSGNPINAGVIWRITPRWSPSISLAIRDMGGTKYSNTSGGDDLEVAEDMTIGFGLSPTVGKWGRFNLVVEGGHLSNDTAINEKLRVGTELSVAGFGSNALMALRAGYNFDGASYGASINLGILSFQYSNHAANIGIAGERVIERRTTTIFVVNVAEN